MTCASTGASERTLRRVGMPYKKIYVHVNNHAGYYPGAGQIDIKLLFDEVGGRWSGCVCGSCPCACFTGGGFSAPAGVLRSAHPS